MEKTATDNVYKVLGSNISITTTSTNVDAGAVDPDQDDLKALIVEPHGEDGSKVGKDGRNRRWSKLALKSP